MTTSMRWTSADLEALPNDGKRYEIIDGELHVLKQPHWYHQFVCGQIFSALQAGGEGTGQANLAPGLIFADDDDAAPDVVWISNARLATALGVDGKLHAAPELVVEVLSPGAINEHRDRDVKLKLYSRRGVLEYWIADWQLRQITVYRREQAQLRLISTLFESDTLQTPLLVRLSVAVARIFEGIPSGA